MTLSGNEEYEFTLGDEMRAYRDTLGVSLEDAERDLRIRASTILAIEDSDLAGFPNQGVIPGYVRTYARYLGMDPQRSYRRFCDETGFRSPTAAVARPGAGGGAAISSRAGENLTKSRFAPPPAPERIGSRVSLGAIASAAAMVALVSGLSYGGYQLLQDIQKVGVAESPASPEVVVEAEAPTAPAVTLASALEQRAGRPDASAYEDGGVLAPASARDSLPPRIASRDGPIAELDPHSSGLFASVGRLDANDPRREGQPVRAESETASAPAEDVPGGWNDGVLLASLTARSMTDEPVSDAQRLTMSASAEALTLEPTGRATVIRATEEAWVRIKDGDGTVVFEGILSPGETFELPERMRSPEIRAGNAGGVFVAIGSETYGPLGQPGQVVKNVPLDEEAVRANLPAAEGLQPAAEEARQMQRAQATL